MRLDSNYVRLHIVHSMEALPHTAVRYDDFDVTVVDMADGASVAICLMERPTPLHEIMDVYREHNRNRTHVVYVLWQEMLLPNHGDIFEPPDWLKSLYTLHHNQVYAFKNLAHEVDIFPLSFERIGLGAERLVKHGAPVHLGDVGCAFVEVEEGPLMGRWGFADFIPGRGRAQAERVYQAQREEAERRQRFYEDFYRQQTGLPKDTPQDRLLSCHRELGVPVGAQWETIKKAYRDLARQYHPDLNPHHEATARMQAINAAYAFLLTYYDEGSAA
jgi:hypothetical protein